MGVVFNYGDVVCGLCRKFSMVVNSGSGSCYAVMYDCG